MGAATKGEGSVKEGWLFAGGMLGLGGVGRDRALVDSCGY